MSRRLYDSLRRAFLLVGALPSQQGLSDLGHASINITADLYGHLFKETSVLHLSWLRAVPRGRSTPLRMFTSIAAASASRAERSHENPLAREVRL